MIRTVDYTALISPPTRQDVAAFKRQMKQSGSLWTTSTISAQAGNVIALLVIGVALAVQVTSLPSAIRSAVDAVFLTPLLLSIVTIVVLIVVAGFVVKRIVSQSAWKTWFLLDSFAKANGFAFSPASAGPGYPGAIFGLGNNQQRYNHLLSLTGRDIDMGNYRYVTRSGKNSTTRSWGYLAIRLDRNLPHMLLDARSNNGLFGMTNLPREFAKNQTLSLEGDFNKHFTLYCPREYEGDALYVFTPDLMSLLIDKAAPFDVEIVDDWLFVYSADPFESVDPQVYQRLFSIIDTVAAKTLSQTDRYADERIGDPSVNLVAPAGQRLKSGWGVGTIIFLGIFVGAWTLVTVFFR